MSYYPTNGLKNSNKKQNANKNNKNIANIINIVIIECTTSFLVSGFLPTASATLPPRRPIPSPNPKKASPTITPIATAVADKILSIYNSSFYIFPISLFIYPMFLSV